MTRATQITRIAAAFAAMVLLPGAFSACGGGGDDDAGDSNPFGLEKEAVAEAPDPVSLTFAPDGRLFFAEKYTGNIRVVDAGGNLIDEPFAHVDAATWLSYQGTDWGLTGLALDPDFEANHYVYAFYSEFVNASETQPTARPILVRFTDQENRGVDRTVIIDDFAETQVNHQGFKTNGALHFGPEGALYLSMGDYDWGKNGPNGIGAAQDLSVPPGKMLRVNSSGEAVPDNPQIAGATDKRIFAYGVSHGRPFAFHPQTKGIYTSDATDSCEELDLVTPGGNYGWPDVGEFPFSDCSFGDQVEPIYLFAKEGSQPGNFQSGPGVSGLAFLTASRYPSIGDGLLVCENLTGVLRRLVLAGTSFNQVTASDVIVEDCGQDVTVDADGTIYYSNKTGITRLLPGPTPTVTQ